MPTSTARYRFEFAMLEWATRFVVGLATERCAFFVGLRDDGTVRRVYVAPPGTGFDAGQQESLKESHTRWLLYMPYEESQSGYLEWLNLDQKIAAQWLQRRLQSSDFQDVRGGGDRERWPESWRVIFA